MGRQSKPLIKARGQKRRERIAVVVIAVLALVATFLYNARSDSDIMPTPSVKIVAKKFDEIAHQKIDWSAPIVYQLERTTDATVERLQSERTKIVALLERYRNSSEKTRFVASQCAPLGIGILIPIDPSLARGVTLLEDKGAVVTIMLLSKEYEVQLPTPELAYFEETHPTSVQLKVREAPDAFLAALLYHELWHLVRFRDRADKAFVAEEFHDQEEVRAHEGVERDVLDTATSGKYVQLIRTILARRDGARLPPHAILDLIGRKDLDDLWVMLALSGHSGNVQSLIVGEFARHLLFAYADEVAYDPMMVKVAYYRELGGQ